MPAPLSSPATNAAAVTKGDSTALAGIRGLYVGGAGDVAVKMIEGGSTVTFVGCAAGSILPICPVRVMDATTATSIVALY